MSKDISSGPRDDSDVAVQKGKRFQPLAVASWNVRDHRVVFCFKERKPSPQPLGALNDFSSTVVAFSSTGQEKRTLRTIGVSSVSSACELPVNRTKNGTEHPPPEDVFDDPTWVAPDDPGTVLVGRFGRRARARPFRPPARGRGAAGAVRDMELEHGFLILLPPT